VTGRETGSRARRDPEGRRQAIVEAAAALVVEDGVTELTHRRVAERAGVPLGATTYYFSSLGELEEEALRHLAEWIEADLREVARELEACGGEPAHLAEMMHAYLRDRARMRADAALYVAATRREELRPLALRWFDGLVEVLSTYTDAESARALAVFADGAAMHAMLHDEPLDVAFLTGAVVKLAAGRPGEVTGR